MSNYDNNYSKYYMIKYIIDIAQPNWADSYAWNRIVRFRMAVRDSMLFFETGMGDNYLILKFE